MIEKDFQNRFYFLLIGTGEKEATVRKEKMRNDMGISRHLQAMNFVFPYFIRNGTRHQIFTKDENIWGYRIPLSQAPLKFKTSARLTFDKDLVRD